MANTILWRNLALVHETDGNVVQRKDDPEDDGPEVQASVADTIFVYMRRGAVIEVHPATGVRLTNECVEVINVKTIVAAYPRERVIMASNHLVEPMPFC